MSPARRINTWTCSRTQTVMRITNITIPWNLISPSINTVIAEWKLTSFSEHSHGNLLCHSSPFIWYKIKKTPTGSSRKNLTRQVTAGSHTISRWTGPRVQLGGGGEAVRWVNAVTVTQCFPNSDFIPSSLHPCVTKRGNGVLCYSFEFCLTPGHWQ